MNKRVFDSLGVNVAFQGGVDQKSLGHGGETGGWQSCDQTRHGGLSWSSSLGCELFAVSLVPVFCFRPLSTELAEASLVLAAAGIPSLR